MFKAIPTVILNYGSCEHNRISRGVKRINNLYLTCHEVFTNNLKPYNYLILYIFMLAFIPWVYFLQEETEKNECHQE